MSRLDPVEVVRLLEVLIGIIARPDTDLSWSGYDDPEVLITELRGLIRRMRQPDPDAGAVREISLLFAPTGRIQEIAISSGWGEGYLVLAEQMDRALGPVAWRAFE